MAVQPKPFSAFETMIAWRYLRAKRAEGGVSVMTWISLIGITLAVFALIATLAVRAGFRLDDVTEHAPDADLAAQASTSTSRRAHCGGSAGPRCSPGSPARTTSCSAMAARL